MVTFNEEFEKEYKDFYDEIDQVELDYQNNPSFPSEILAAAIGIYESYNNLKQTESVVIPSSRSIIPMKYIILNKKLG